MSAFIDGVLAIALKFFSATIIANRDRLRQLLVTALLVLLSACGNSSDNGSAKVTGDSSSTDNSNAPAAAPTAQLDATMFRVNGVLELTISGLGSQSPQTEVKWISPPGMGGTPKTIASTVPLPNFLDVASQATSTVDSAGFRHIAATLKVRNAPQCVAPAAPGTCPGYASTRNNVAFFGVMTSTTINQTAVSRFKRFDGSDANFALTTQLLPAHGLSGAGLAVDPALASLVVYNESELPVPDSGAVSVFPYAFAVRNVNDGSRILPANPASGKYDGVVTFGFRIPLQTPSTEDPFKISMRFQTADDSNLRTTQSIQEQTFAGDLAATTRTLGVGGIDLAVLGGRIAQTTIGNPICRVRIAGPAAAPTAFLANNAVASSNLAAAPVNLSFVNVNSEVSLGFCEQMSAPTANTLFVYGSQSGMRKVGSAYSGTVTGGTATSRPNQLIWNFAGQRPFFLGEQVSFIATAGNLTQTAVPIAAFVGQFRVRGSVPNAGSFTTPFTFGAGVLPHQVALGDFNGDGVLDSATVNASSDNVSVVLGNGTGVPTFHAVGAGPQFITLGDVNGDGRIDIVTSSFFSGTVSVLLGNGAGGFGAATNLSVPFAGESALGDLNGDGRLDIVTVDSGIQAYVFLNNGAGGFAAPGVVTVSSGGSAQNVKLGDMNGDGNLDMVVTNRTGGPTSSVQLLLGNGTGAFVLGGNFTVGEQTSALTLGDVNADGRLDIVTANSAFVTANQTVSVLLGDGAGGFSPVTNYPSGGRPQEVTLGDINGDGRLDIVVANFFSSSVSVLLGNGVGGFAAATNFSTGGRPFNVALGDVNLDGRLDIVTPNYDSANISVLAGF